MDEDRFTFDDSDRFEEDSLCSWSSEPESLCNHWRGWKRPGAQGAGYSAANRRYNEDGIPTVATLSELTARCVATHIPFELVEHVCPPVPEQLQLRIAFWSFPDNEEDIRMYSCLANGSADEFQKGDHLFRSKSVRDPLQIGFHLSASVVSPMLTSAQCTYNVAVTFDRRKITSCNCTCNLKPWCCHVVAVCLHRIHKPDKVCLRAPVSESLSRLHREQLQKFAQYLISELPQQILPTAQRLLDELLSSQPSAINSVCGAPDPTAGASVTEQTSWYLDDKTLHENINKILIKFCVPAPIVFSDVNYLSTTAPPAAAEWSSLLRPLRGREPEGMWNLLSIVREMFKRNDRNAVPLLEIITEECMACEQILVWWFNTCVALHSGAGGGKHAGANSNAHASQHACSSLCDEIVILWRLTALNPGISPDERELLEKKFTDWHSKIIEKVTKSKSNSSSNNNNNNANKTAGVDVFPGFGPAIEACKLDWVDYPLPGITYTAGSSELYHCPFTCFRHGGEGNIVQVNSSQAVLNCHYNYNKHNTRRVLDLSSASNSNNTVTTNTSTTTARRRHNNNNNNQDHKTRDGNRSSMSSEGFCENDADADLPNETNVVKPSTSGRVLISSVHDDTDSQEGGGSDTASSTDVSPPCRSPRTQNVVTDTCGVKIVRSLVKKNSVSSEESDVGVFTDETKVMNKNELPAANILNNEQVLVGDLNNRRPSNDSATSNSDSIHSNEDYNMYYYHQHRSTTEKPSTSVTAMTKDDHQQQPQQVLADGGDKDKINDDPWDVLFARAEGLHAHGHGLEACTLAVRLALELLADPPNLLIDLPVISNKGKRRKVNPASHHISCLASATLAKCAFLCAVLTEVTEHHHLAFRVGLFGLEMARPPASTKPLEVKLANQETDLVNLLKRIPLGANEICSVREKAEQLKGGTFRSRGEALLPIMLASFIFDALEGSAALKENRTLTDLNRGDECLAFEAAVSALGLKANVSEADHPLLCEGTRRQRGDLAITLLVHYKYEPAKLARIMEKLLDREVHTLIKSPLCAWYYCTTPHPRSIQSKIRKEDTDTLVNGMLSCYDVVSNDVASSCSRPHSSTSAELEQNLGGLNLNPPSAQQTMGRGKDMPRFKGKRLYPSIPNQPSEAGAHFMFELAKTVLTKAGGNSSTSLFTQATTSQQHHGPHRALHVCAFQIGLYALGLHNCVSPNWLSRTYSSHVSWITGQAMEIGALAISFLIDTWEGHLTPPEAVNIADRASRGCDPNMVRAAAELALSCLPHAHALNPNEIQRAILQCKEQSDVMLEHACLTVENAAKGGGVYPEVLFQVARYWYDLYMGHTPLGEQQSMEPEVIHDPTTFHFTFEQHTSVVTVVDHQQDLPPANLIAQPMTLAPPQQQQQQQQQQAQQQARPPPNFPPTVPPPAAAAVMAPVPYAVAAAPYSFTLHQFQPPRALPLPPPPHHHHHHLGLYISPPQFQYQNPQPQQYFVQGNPPVPLRPVAYPLATMQQGQIQMNPNPNQLQLVPPPPAAIIGAQAPAGLPVQALVRPQQQPQQPQLHRQSPTQYSPAQFRYLCAAYRVGMLALETLARRVHDDRPQAKYARNPPYGEDVKWLLRVSKKLGTQYLHQFCMCVLNSIVSPFILHDVALEAAYYLARNNPSLVLHQLRSLTQLVQKCQQMYIQCMHQKLYHLTTADYDDFVSVVIAARAAFHITPEGSQQFKEWLQSIRRSKSCKKDLWAQINTALQQSSNK